MDAPENDEIHVEVAYAIPERQHVAALTLPAGSTAIEAVRASGIEQEFPGLSVDEGTRLGVFGQVIAHSTPLQEGDRVEIYRPLLADPKAVRKARAARSRARREPGDDA